MRVRRFHEQRRCRTLTRVDPGVIGSVDPGDTRVESVTHVESVAHVESVFARRCTARDHRTHGPVVLGTWLRLVQR